MDFTGPVASGVARHAPLLARFELAHWRRNYIRLDGRQDTNIDLLDALAAAFDLLDRDDRLPDVLVRLIEMTLQLADAIAEQTHVFDQTRDFVTDLVGGLAHARIFLALLHQRIASISSDGDTITTRSR